MASGHSAVASTRYPRGVGGGGGAVPQHMVRSGGRAVVSCGSRAAAAAGEVTQSGWQEAVRVRPAGFTYGRLARGSSPGADAKCRNSTPRRETPTRVSFAAGASVRGVGGGGGAVPGARFPGGEAVRSLSRRRAGAREGAGRGAGGGGGRSRRRSRRGGNGDVSRSARHMVDGVRAVRQNLGHPCPESPKLASNDMSSLVLPRELPRTAL